MTPTTPEDKRALNQLYAMMMQEKKRRYPNVPYLAPPKQFDVRQTSKLEGAICEWFKCYGYNAERVHVMGRQIGADKVYFNEITGKVQCIDKAKWIPSTGKKGTADISVTCRNKDGGVMALKIEVKNAYHNDRMRPDQVKYREEHERSGGTYLIVRYFSQFVEWFEENVQKSIYY